MLTSPLLVTLLATSSAYALVFNGAKPTYSSLRPAGTGDLLKPPTPTKAPYIDAELLKRQEVATELLASDNTCGYFSGLAGMSNMFLLPPARLSSCGRLSLVESTGVLIVESSCCN
jgi:hypothetical protein